MRTRHRSWKWLSIAGAVALFTIVFATWNMKPAEAIIIIDTKTGMFTLAPHEAVRVYVANTADEAGIIIIGGGIFDSQGNLLQRIEQRVAPGQAGLSQYSPPVVEGMLLPVRVELRFQRTGRGTDAIPTVEVVDTETGQTRLFVDYIIDDGK